MQDLCTENYKTSPKEFKGSCKQKDIPHSWPGTSNICKRAILSKLVTKSSGIPTKISAGLFAENEKLILNSYGNARDSE